MAYGHANFFPQDTTTLEPFPALQMGYALTKTGTFDFDSVGGTWEWTGPGPFNDCGAYFGTGPDDPAGLRGTFAIRAGKLITNLGVQTVTRTSEKTFVWDVLNLGRLSAHQCTLTTAPPNAVNNLVATDTASGIKLTWSDQSTNESGFRVERKAAPISSAWATLQSLGVNVVSFTDTSPAIGETWQYRVFAFNTYGDSYTSSVVQKTHTVTSN